VPEHAPPRHGRYVGGFDDRDAAGGLRYREAIDPKASQVERDRGADAFLDLQAELARLLGRPVGLVTPAAIKERMRARIERAAVDAV